MNRLEYLTSALTAILGLGLLATRGTGDQVLGGMNLAVSVLFLAFAVSDTRKKHTK
jgi:hypothetical protein